VKCKTPACRATAPLVKQTCLHRKEGSCVAFKVVAPMGKLGEPDDVSPTGELSALADEQKAQLREREATEKAAAESAFLKLYTEFWLPKVEGSGIGLEPVAAGGRPLQTTLNEKKDARIHECVLEPLREADLIYG
jgi:hypothetical protein